MPLLYVGICVLFKPHVSFPFFWACICSQLEGAHHIVSCAFVDWDIAFFFFLETARYYFNCFPSVDRGNRNP